MDSMRIYSTGTHVELKENKHMTAIVDKVIIGANQTVQYQLIVYTPNRDQLLVNSFEISGVARESRPPQPIGFHPNPNSDVKEVLIFVDDNRKLLDWASDAGVSVKLMGQLDYEERSNVGNGQKSQA